MAQEQKSGISIWILLSPLYLLLLYPIFKMAVRNNSNDLQIDKNAFSVDAEVQKRKSGSGYQPMLNNAGGYSVSYNAGGDDKTREEIGWGATDGYLLSVLESNANDTELLKELYNSKYMIQGFMAREDTQYYLFSSSRIDKMLSDKTAVLTFLKEPGIKALLANSKAMETVLSSAFTDALISEQAAQDFMKDSAAIERILTDNKSLVRLIKMPAMKNFIVKNRKTSNLAKAVGWK